ncbi:hypothetical protein CWR48_05860 [Oceanobacillus arenosus]|uniref:CamS family sex pheromone protein n=1 Tax=Oceanobacillus arenosus TaxID=1229153 RepID=A0A3D8PVS7_9BACI|nr:CamS family sex pheromone protein [Oceanobacillus arenosus]RDW20226.1 hypothetical protein CWR48_05860 [Oceanobacillus arenosus]
MKRISIGLLCALLLLASCAPNNRNDEEEVVNKDDQKTKTSIVPSYRLADDNYRIIIPYEPSEARGVIVNQVANRLDIDEMEEGLRRHSTEVFDPKELYFQEGQYLTSDMVYEWLGRGLTKEQLEEKVQAEIARLKGAKMTVNEEKIRAEFQNGLNPPIEDIPENADQDEKVELNRESPRYLSHILEQNYLKPNDNNNTVELAGISIGLALKSVYRFQTETGGPYYYEDIPLNEAMKQGNEIAGKILERIRGIEGLENIPVMFALYREEDQSSPVPGNFVAKTNVAGGSATIGKWEDITEEYVLFPSAEGQKNYIDDHEIVTSFGNEIAKFFPNYVGIIGEGFYVNKELQELTIEIPIEFYGESEIIGFTQYAYGLVQNMFPNYYDIEVNVTSINGNESLIYREAGEDTPIVHIFH